MNTYLTEAIHPRTREVYRLGDIVCIYQGRFGHNNIMTIKTIISSSNGNDIELYVSDKEIKEADINNTDETRGAFTNLSAVKHKLTEKKVKEIQRAKQLASQYS